MPENAHAIFATIVPGFSSPIEGHEGLEFLLKSPAVGTFYSDSEFNIVFKFFQMVLNYQRKFLFK